MNTFPKCTSRSLPVYTSCLILILLFAVSISPSMGSEQWWGKGKPDVSVIKSKTKSDASTSKVKKKPGAATSKVKRKPGVNVGTVIGIGTLLKGTLNSGEEKTTQQRRRCLKPKVLTRSGRCIFPKSRQTAEYKNITQIQKCLNKLGYPAGKADGILGPNTRKAFAKFASQNGMSGKGVHDKKAVDKLQQQCEKRVGDPSETELVETSSTVTVTACKDGTWRYKDREKVADFEWKLPTPLKIDIQPVDKRDEFAVPGAESFLGALGKLFGLLDIVIDPSASNVAAGVAGIPTNPMGYAGYAAKVGSEITQAAKRIGAKLAGRLLTIRASFNWQKVTVKCGLIEICEQGSWVEGGLWPLEKPKREKLNEEESYTANDNQFEGKDLRGKVQAAWNWYAYLSKISSLEKFNQNPCQNVKKSKLGMEPKESSDKQQNCRNCDRLKQQVKQIEDEISKLKSDKEQIRKDLQALSQTEMDEKEKLESSHRKCVQRARENSEKGMIYGAVNKETGNIIGTTDPAGLSGLDPNVWEIYDGGNEGKSLESQQKYKEKMFKAEKERCDKVRQQGLERLLAKMGKKRQSLGDELQKLEEELGKLQQKLDDLKKKYQACMQGCNHSQEATLPGM